MRVLWFQTHRSGTPKPEQAPQEDHLIRAQRSAQPAGAASKHNGAHHARKRERPFARKNDDRQCERKRRLAENQRQQRRKKHQQSTVKSFAYQPVQHERGTRLAPQRIYREVEPRRKEKQRQQLRYADAKAKLADRLCEDEQRAAPEITAEVAQPLAHGRGTLRHARAWRRKISPPRRRP